MTKSVAPHRIDTRTDPEALYRKYWRCGDGCWDYDYGGIKPDHQCYVVIVYTITKKTAKRIYFKDGYGRRYFVERAAFDADGTVYHRKLRDRLHLDRPEIPQRPKPKSVAELRREMAEAHPDRGGDRDTFMAARERYLRARRTA